MIRITGLWKKTTKDGKTYLQGSLGVAKLVVLPNKFKQKDEDPDYNLLVSEKQEKRDNQETGF
jgi:hypothetical protein